MLFLLFQYPSLLFISLNLSRNEYRDDNSTNLIAWMYTLHLVVHLHRCKWLYCFTLKTF